MAHKHSAWVSMQLTYVGNVQALLKQGGGKLSPTADDPGEPRKPSGTG